MGFFLAAINPYNDPMTLKYVLADKSSRNVSNRYRVSQKKRALVLKSLYYQVPFIVKDNVYLKSKHFHWGKFNLKVNN